MAGEETGINEALAKAGIDRLEQIWASTSSTR